MHAGTARRWSPAEACDQATQRRIAAAAKATARCRAVGNLMVVAMAVLACLMAAHALHGEQRQMEQLQQLR